MYWHRAVVAARTTPTYLLRSAYLMYLLARDRRVPWIARGVAAGSAGYVLFPFNLIPDYVPVIGFADDIGVVWFGLWVARLLVPMAVIAEHRATVQRRFPGPSSVDPPEARRPARPARAFGVDSARSQFYSLRQSRYDALAQDVSDWVSAASAARLRLLIIGCGAGTELRYLEARPCFARLAVSGANIDDKAVYRREIYEEFFVGDFTHGYPEMAANAYDIVLCEQVLEHLDEIDVAIAALGRVLKPGGRAIVGVPIFPPPLHLIRRHIVPRLDVLLRRRRPRGHRQAFSLASFLAALQAHSGLRVFQGARVPRGLRRRSARPRQLSLVVALQPPPGRARSGALHRGSGGHGKARAAR